VSPGIQLAPMEGLADHVLRELLSRVGGYDRGTCEFVRVSGSLLPQRTYRRICPELDRGSMTGSGMPVAVQLLGSDPGWMAENAAQLCALAPAGIDLNFGCPAKTVNRHGGGAMLLATPEVLYRVASAIRKVVPRHIPYSAKMRLGVSDTSRALECAQALEAGGVEALAVHARTRDDGYRPPAHWEWIGRIRAAVKLPVVANGEIWSVADYLRCRAESGATDVMLGRGAVADPFLARRIRAGTGQSEGDARSEWLELLPLVAEYWRLCQDKVAGRHAPGRLKSWLAWLRRRFPEAEALYGAVRTVNDPGATTRLLGQYGVPVLPDTGVQSGPSAPTCARGTDMA
jgi:tRNA-dihydrouridine synthase C